MASDWSAFQEILRRKNEEVAVEIPMLTLALTLTLTLTLTPIEVAVEIPMLRKKIIEEDETLLTRVEEVIAA